MAVIREDPYGRFNFIVSLGGAQGDGQPGPPVGGFSDVEGIGIEVSHSDYRNGNDKVNTARKIPNTHKLDDVTLKRGLIGSADLLEWLQSARDGIFDPRDVTISLLDEARTQTVATWRLRRAQPKKWTGPTLSGAGGEVAGESLTITHEGIVME
jgi:phage tail-like protein